MGYTNAEEFTIPSLGKIYNKTVNPVVKLRSMSTEDEMLRLSHSERPYKVLCDMIDNCIVGNKPGISTYDMCLGDYQFLLHKLRIVTYGSDYLTQTVCKWCGATNQTLIDLESLEVKQYDDSLDEHFEFTLPRSSKIIKLNFQTPRSMDDIALKIKEHKKKYPDAPDPSLVYTLKSLIQTVDGEVLDSVKLENFVRKLPMADTNIILQHAKMINKGIGIESGIIVECKECGVDYDAPFRVTSEFFGPSIYF